MTYTMIAIVVCIVLIIMILSGVHIGFSLGMMSFLGIYFLTDSFSTAISLLANTAYSAVRQYTFAVVPLFILMGCFMSHSGVAKDLFDTMNYFLKKIPGGMGIATVLSNAVFAAVTGVSVASAAVFSKISLPAMREYGYKTEFALGTIAGSSVLGMLIPPSLLLIVYGTLSEVSIGKLFIAGIIPGIVLSLVYCIGIIIMALFVPNAVYDKSKKNSINVGGESSFFASFIKSLPVFIIIIIVLGGIWGGFFTPTEASAIGAMCTMILSILKGMRFEEIKIVLLESGATTATIMFLLITAQMYSRMLTMSGLTSKLAKLVTESNLSEMVIIACICLMLVVLGCLLDSTSILLLTVPLILPIGKVLGWDLIWLGILMIVVIEMGLLTPPFGMVVFAMKATIKDPDVTVEGIFKGGMPYLFMMIIVVIILIKFPILTTWLPGLS